VTETKRTKIGLDKKIPVMRGAFLRFPLAMRQVARVSHVGCIKYNAPEGDMDYLAVPDGVGVFSDADGRHLLDEVLDGPVNVERGGNLPKEGMAVLHAAQHAWNALARLEKQLRRYRELGIDIDAILGEAPLMQDPSVGLRPDDLKCRKKPNPRMFYDGVNAPVVVPCGFNAEPGGVTFVGKNGLPTTRRVPRGVPLDKCDRHDFGVTQEDLGDCDPGC
jgi:hypothetical protein